MIEHILIVLAKKNVLDKILQGRAYEITRNPKYNRY